MGFTTNPWKGQNTMSDCLSGTIYTPATEISEREDAINSVVCYLVWTRIFHLNTYLQTSGLELTELCCCQQEGEYGTGSVLRHCMRNGACDFCWQQTRFLGKAEETLTPPLCLPQRIWGHWQLDWFHTQGIGNHTNQKLFAHLCPML